MSAVPKVWLYLVNLIKEEVYSVNFLIIAGQVRSDQISDPTAEHLSRMNHEERVRAGPPHCNMSGAVHAVYSMSILCCNMLCLMSTLYRVQYCAEAGLLSKVSRLIKVTDLL